MPMERKMLHKLILFADAHPNYLVYPVFKADESLDNGDPKDAVPMDVYDIKTDKVAVFSRENASDYGFIPGTELIYSDVINHPFEFVAAHMSQKAFTEFIDKHQDMFHDKAHITDSEDEQFTQTLIDEVINKLPWQNAIVVYERLAERKDV